ncbi:hypothetical protein V8C43DRAFT_293820 [Trichoderma afarasin]
MLRLPWERSQHHRDHWKHEAIVAAPPAATLLAKQDKRPTTHIPDHAHTYQSYSPSSVYRDTHGHFALRPVNLLFAAPRLVCLVVTDTCLRLSISRIYCVRCTHRRYNKRASLWSHAAWKHYRVDPLPLSRATHLANNASSSFETNFSYRRSQAPSRIAVTKGGRALECQVGACSRCLER